MSRNLELAQLAKSLTVDATGTITDLNIDTTAIEELPDINLNIAPEVLEIQVDAPDVGQDTMWKWTWEQSTLPYARRTITNSNELNVPLYKEGTYVVNNFAAYDIHANMTQTHSLYLKWVDGAGTDNLVSWATSAGPISDSHPDINGGNATDVQRISVNVPSTVTPPSLTNPSVAYTVVNNGSGGYTFSGSAKGDNPNLGPFYRGGTYTINITATGHPFYFTTDNGTNFSAGTYFGEYTSGVTGSRNETGSITFTVPAGAPDTLYYQCGNHSAMRGEITVKDLAVETNINGNYVVYFQHTQEGHRTPVELRPIPSLVNQMCLVYDSTSGKFVPQDLATYVENTPSFENKIREVAGTAELVVEDGSAVIAKVNVYDDSTYLPLTGNNPGDQAFATDTDILYIWDGTAWQQAGAANSDDLTEGSTNLFFTNERSDDRVASLIVGGNNITSTYDDTAGTLTLDGQPGYTDSDVASYLSSNDFDTATNIIASITDSAPATLDTLNELAAALGDDPNFATTTANNIATKLAITDFTSTADTWLGTKSTTNVVEGTNLYYTDARADARITASDTDALSEGSTNLYYTDARADARITASDTDALSEGSTNLYYTDGRVGTYLTTNSFATETYVDNVFNVNFNTIVNTFTATGSNTFTLSVSTTTNNAFVYVNDVPQRPSVDYTINNTTLTFANSPVNADDVFVRITNHSIPTGTPADGTVSDAKLAGNLTLSGQYVGIPKGTTAQRPNPATVGQFRFNTEINALEQYTSDGWVSLEAPPVLQSISPTSFDGNTNTTITLTGSSFAAGAVATFVTQQNASVNASTTTFVDSNTLTATTPRDFLTTESPLTVRITNPSGLTAELSGALDAGDPPNWNTTAGTIATVSDVYQSVSVTVAATDPEGSSIVYALESGALPVGTTLSGNTISGTVSAVSGTTTSSFVLSATDNAGNSTNRSFNIITNPVLDGTSSSRAAASALDVIDNVLAAGGSASDYQALEGALWINPGFAYGSAFQIYCDMNTQGGGWTLCAKYDADQATSSLFSFQRGLRGYSNTNELSTLNAGGSLSAYIDLRDIINYDRTKSSSGIQYGGRYLMHAACNNGSATRTRNSYTSTSKNFTSSQTGGSANGSNGHATVTYSPMFSQLHKNIYDGSQTTKLFDTQGSWITNNGGAATPSTVQRYDASSDIQTYGGGVFNGLGSSITSAPTEMLNRIDIYGGTDDHSQTNDNTAARQDHYDGQSMFTVFNREGSVYCSGSQNGTSVVGHNSPKFQYGFYSADGTQMSYGMGEWAMGTHCNTPGTSSYGPEMRMNFMFIR